MVFLHAKIREKVGSWGQKWSFDTIFSGNGQGIKPVSIVATVVARAQLCQLDRRHKQALTSLRLHSSLFTLTLLTILDINLPGKRTPG